MRLQRDYLAVAVLAGCAASALLAATAPARRPRPASCAGTAPAANLSMEQAVKMVETRFHARVVKAVTEKDNGRTVYLLRLLDDAGRVWTVHVDAASGSVQ
jgi:uncharacterized membrane protein YkoI